MPVSDEHARREAFARLQELIATGREYDAFARERPREAEAQIAALNAPGRQAEAWDLRWVPEVLRARIARVSSLVVIDLCRRSGVGQNPDETMDALMPAAILTACVVADSYGVNVTLPAHPLPRRAAVFAALLRRVLEQPEALAAIASGGALPPLPPIVACLPPRIRERLLGLAHLMAPRADPVRVAIVTTIFIIGAVAAETFEPLNFCAEGS